MSHNQAPGESTRDSAGAAPEADRGLARAHIRASARAPPRARARIPTSPRSCRPASAAGPRGLDRSTRPGPPAAAPAPRPGSSVAASPSTSPRFSAATPFRMVSTSFVDIASKRGGRCSRQPVSRLRSGMERGRRVAPRCPRRYHEQCAAKAAGTRRPSSREMRFGPARMRVGKPVNCYPSQAPSEEGSGDSVTRGCGRDAGIFNLERHRATTASRTDSGSPRASSANRLHVRGKSLYEGDSKMHVRGVTYGTFRPDEETSDFPSVESVAEDFAGMAANGVNAVRTYTVPPRWLLDLAQRARAVRDGRAALGGARHVPRRPQADRRDRGARARDGALLRGPSGDPLLRDRERDPGLDRALARQAHGSSAS